MKKLYFAIIALAALTLASCEKTPVGGTATQALAGQWSVLMQGVDSAGNVLYEDEDLFGYGPFQIITYNTAENQPDTMWLSCMSALNPSFLTFRLKVACDVNALTFEGKELVNYDGSHIDVRNGKVLPKAAKTPSGMPADSIVFDYVVEGDPYTAYYDFIRITGFRYTGLVNDELE
jgi:hypothetical protein